MCIYNVKTPGSADHISSLLKIFSTVTPASLNICTPFLVPLIPGSLNRSPLF